MDWWSLGVSVLVSSGSQRNFGSRIHCSTLSLFPILIALKNGIICRILFCVHIMPLFSFRMFSNYFIPLGNRSFKCFGFIPNIAQSDFTTYPEHFLITVHLQFPFQKGWYLHIRCYSYQFNSSHCNIFQRLSSH